MFSLEYTCYISNLNLVYTYKINVNSPTFLSKVPRKSKYICGTIQGYSVLARVVTFYLCNFGKGSVFHKQKLNARVGGYFNFYLMRRKCLFLRGI